jgi:hypothetical protein
MRGIIFFFLFVSFSLLHSQPVTLRDTTNQYDYIIITTPEFVTACEPFKQHKEIVRDFRTLIVDTTQIFAEFDTSATPQDNIRDFISYAGTFWLEPRPMFFLLVGTVQMVPNFQIPFPSQPTIYYQSDYFYTQNIYENDSTTTDYYIGRIPCWNDTEIFNYFSKVIEYESNATIYSWMNNVLFVCGDDSYYPSLNFAFGIESQFPPFIRSYYISDNDTSQYYGNIDSIYQAINERGNALVWFLGPTEDTTFASWIGLEDLNGLSNNQKYFFTFFSGHQSAILETNNNLTRAMLTLPYAGSLGGGVFVGLTYVGIGQVVALTWAERFFDPTMNSLGEVFILDSLPSYGVYYYVKKVANLWADPSLKLKYDMTVDVEKITGEVPNNFVLNQNYPNPFNPTTKIKYTIPSITLRQAQSDIRVSLKVYDVLGNEITTLVNEEKPAGTYEVEFDATNLPSGVYFYQLRAGNFIETKKMILMK